MDPTSTGWTTWANLLFPGGPPLGAWRGSMPLGGVVVSIQDEGTRVVSALIPRLAMCPCAFRGVLMRGAVRHVRCRALYIVGL